MLFCLFVCVFVCLATYLYLVVSFPVCVCVCFYRVCVCLSFLSFVCLFVCLFVYLFVRLFSSSLSSLLGCLRRNCPHNRDSSWLKKFYSRSPCSRIEKSPLICVSSRRCSSQASNLTFEYDSVTCVVCL